jgi:prolyl-tRNA editing enzyme YbaK/EbsC (Cys-tRNA(Pro) deacylase)
VAAALAAQGVDASVRELDASAATVAEAAAAIGTTPSRIVKSLVFSADHEPVVVLASGTNRVDTRKLGALLGRRVRRADADAVRRATGFAIGGVPPLGYAQPVRVFVDRELLRFDEVWAAGGTPNSVFPIGPDDLVRVSGGQLADVKDDAT